MDAAYLKLHVEIRPFLNIELHSNDTLSFGIWCCRGMCNVCFGLPRSGKQINELVGYVEDMTELEGKKRGNDGVKWGE